MKTIFTPDAHQNATAVRDTIASVVALSRCLMHIWKPSITVAAIVCRDQRFLLVEEETAEGLRLNQPAGHLEPNESLEQAVVRETLEETAYEFHPTALLGVYHTRYQSPALSMDKTYVRFAFTGELGALLDRPLDTGIVRAVWLTLDELKNTQAMHRSPVVLQCAEDYLRGIRVPLDFLHTQPNVFAGALHD